MDCIVRLVNGKELNKKVIGEDLNAIFIVSDNNKTAMIYKHAIKYIKYPANVQKNIKSFQEVQFFTNNMNKELKIKFVDSDVPIVGQLKNFYKDKIIIKSEDTIIEIYKNTIAEIEEK